MKKVNSEESELANLRKRLPFKGIKHISEKLNLSRSTVVDCLSNVRGNRRIDSGSVIEEAYNLIEGKDGD